LIDLPEIRKVEEDNMKKKDKENKKDAVKRRLLPLKEVTQHPSNIPATRPTVKRGGSNGKTRTTRIRQTKKTSKSILLPRKNHFDSFKIRSCYKVFKPTLKHNV
jgi:hypothetical protein